MTRHENEIGELEEGDRIAQELVAVTPGQLGGRVSANPDDPETELVAVTFIERMNDVHSAILVDPEEEALIRATCHDSSSAWTQKEEDWEVQEIGERVVVEEATVEEVSGEEPVESEEEYVQTWVDVLFGDYRMGHFDYEDEVQIEGRSLTLYDPYETRKAHATIHLE